MGLERAHWQMLAKEKAVQFCRLERKGKGWQASHAGMYDSLFLPMAKALKAMQEPWLKDTNAGDWKWIRVYVPIVVTTSKLYFTNQSENGQSEKNIKLEERGYVTFSREIKSKSTNGQFNLTFVNTDRLEEFIKECIDPLTDYISDKFERNPARYCDNFVAS